MHALVHTFVLALAAATALAGDVATTFGKRDYSGTCRSIAAGISSASAVIYPIDLVNFNTDIHHWFQTSQQTPSCVVEVGTPQDTANVLRIIALSKTPFAVMSGGHASNPGFSSTTGVHIALKRFQQIKFSADNSSVEIGTGLTWYDVYKSLQGTGYNVVGGRTQGPGVGGFTTGGGYSWKTNQHGLTSDTVLAYNVVLPNSTIAHITSTSSPDLFFALKGGLNRFGIVTSAVYATHVQPPQVYGGAALYSGSSVQAALDATAQFAKINTDPKAQIITTLNGGTSPSALVLFFYDGPTRPSSFAPFDNLAPLDTLGLSTQTFVSFVGEFPSQPISAVNFRGTFHTLSTSALTPTFISAVLNETNYWAAQMSTHSGLSVSYDIEPFLAYGSKSLPDSQSAYPHSTSPLPLNLYWSWTDPSQDTYWYNAMKTSVNHLRDVAKAEGIYPSEGFASYPNYAISGLSADELYGKNAARVAKVRKTVDPDGVMLLAGGFTF